MKIEFSLNENDFLVHQLYVASKSDRIRKKRQKNKIVSPIFFVVFGFLFYIQDKAIFAIFLFGIIGVLWFFFYPKWEKKHYVNHYKNFIKDNYKKRFGKNLTLDFNNDFILAYDDGSESKILTKELEEIDEITTTIFIRLKGGQSIILPKNKIENIDSLTKELKELATYLNIKYILDDKWEWK